MSIISTALFISAAALLMLVIFYGGGFLVAIGSGVCGGMGYAARREVRKQARR